MTRLDPKYLIVFLITLVLVVGEARYSILGGYDRLATTLGVCMATEVLLSWWLRGKVANLASAYITGISLALLIKPQANILWPFALGAFLAIASKYVLTYRGRHLWNPSNFAIALLLLVASNSVAILSHQWGNDIRINLVIWAFGLAVAWRARVLHVTLVYVACFIVLAVLRNLIVGGPLLAELAPITGPMYQLFVFFMVTDPRTTVSTRRGRMIVVAIVAVVESLIRLAGDFQVPLLRPLYVSPPILALALVGPIAMYLDLRRTVTHGLTAAAFALLGVMLVPLRLCGQFDSTMRSSLRTVDIQSGRIETIYSADQHFEAPNWSRDGRFFVLNSAGRLYRLGADGPQRLEEIPTGFATRVNNDHGISPDGRSLALSHNAQEHITDPQQDWLASSVYVMPIEGSATPVKVTSQAPSFWHGWSPDGKTLAFVGRRDGEFDIYTIPVGGGEERRITTCRGLDDGPDYAPDGAFIYYNSFCSGTMQIWRMRADGSGAEQLTRDAYANWFPHPSPDGRWVVYLAFLEDQGQAHPFGRQVKLRLMDVRTGVVRDLTPPFFGGQGTINVPSWSPDSRRVAFVEYERR